MSDAAERMTLGLAEHKIREILKKLELSEGRAVERVDIELVGIVGEASPFRYVRIYLGPRPGDWK